MQRLAIAILVSGLGLAAAPNLARAQNSGTGSIWLPGGARYPSNDRYPTARNDRYPTNGRAAGEYRVKGNSGKREYIDASGCKVKEENKNGDYKYERDCKHADKNLAKARKEAQKRNRDVYGNDPRRNDGGIWLPGRNDGGVYGTYPRRNDFGLLQRLGIGLP